MRRAYNVAAVRAAEEQAIAASNADHLMSQAAAGLAGVCINILTIADNGIAGSAVVLLVGPGNNGGDTLYAGATLAQRGIRVDAVPVAGDCHAGGLAALHAAGGRVVTVDSEAEVSQVTRLIRDADLVLDGMFGIGGRGPLPEPAATLARAASAGSAFRIAVDVPSGISADTGDVADPEAVFTADLTVTFGCLKQGLVTAPGRDYAGAVELIDIGLNPYLPQMPQVRVLQHGDVVGYLQPPGPTDHKYSRGVAGIAAGSEKYPGAALLCVGGVRRSGVGMVRYVDRDDRVARLVVAAYPDVVLQHDEPSEDPRVSAWAVGPGLGHTRNDERWLQRLLAADAPVVLDADALRILAHSEEQQRQLKSRTERGVLTVLTPHTGEFAALGGTIGPDGRVAAAKEMAAKFNCIIVLKGSGTIVAGPKGAAYADPIASHDLATAGSGDVLTGLIAGFLAHRAAKQQRSESARAVAAAVYLHGLAARLAAQDGQPVVATDLIDFIGPAVATLRASH